MTRCDKGTLVTAVVVFGLFGWLAYIYAAAAPDQGEPVVCRLPRGRSMTTCEGGTVLFGIDSP
jgi:hypothetical protein